MSGVSVEDDSGGFLIRGTCFASFEKKRKRTLAAELGQKPDFRLKSSSCECTAGEGGWSHVAGLLHYAASVVWYLGNEQEEKENEPPPTSKRQSRGLPAAKRRIHPTQTLEETKLQEGQGGRNVH